MKKYLVFVGVLLSCWISLLAACKGGTCPTEPWEDVAWELESYGLPDTLKAPVAGAQVTLQFIKTSKSIGGTAGCNAYFGSYEVVNCRLRISESISTTKKACEGLVMQQEQDYLALLKIATDFSVNNSQLRIACGKQVLVFHPLPNP